MAQNRSAPSNPAAGNDIHLFGASVRQTCQLGQHCPHGSCKCLFVSIYGGSDFSVTIWVAKTRAGSARHPPSFPGGVLEQQMISTRNSQLQASRQYRETPVVNRSVRQRACQWRCVTSLTIQIGSEGGVLALSFLRFMPVYITLECSLANHLQISSSGHPGTRGNTIPTPAHARGEQPQTSIQLTAYRCGASFSNPSL